jgi:hypothetical protein
MERTAVLPLVRKKENPARIDIGSGAMNSKGSFGKRVDFLQDYWTVFIDLDLDGFSPIGFI